MNHPAQGSAVLRPSGVGEAGLAMRRRFDRRNLWLALLVALAFHSAIVLGFWFYDRLHIRDIGDWSGPILVKIGAPDAPEAPTPDPGPLPEQSEEPTPAEPVKPEPEETTADQPAAAAPAEARQDSTPAQPTSSSTGNTGEAVETATTRSPSAAPAPVPSRVRGQEDGNSYEMNFNGTEGEVGRAGAYEFITSYMPLPESLPASLVEGAVPYLSMNSEMIRGEISRYWEPFRDEYVKKRGATVPMNDRPYYWSLLVNALGYDTADADWRQAGTRPVVVEFSVSPSRGARGAELSEFKVVSGSRDPKVDEAVIYGLSRWVYYNDTGTDVRGRITYNFDR